LALFSEQGTLIKFRSTFSGLNFTNILSIEVLYSNDEHSYLHSTTVLSLFSMHFKDSLLYRTFIYLIADNE